MISLLAIALLQADPNVWKQESDQDGFIVESRPPPREKFYEYRVTTDTDLSVAVLCDTIFEWSTVGKNHENLKERKTLADNGDTRVVYDLLELPMVPPRDFAFTMKRVKQKDGSCRLDYFTSNDQAPKLPEGVVRLAKLKGFWSFQPRDSGTHIVYTNYSDPGGKLPASMVHHGQRDAALATVKKAVQLSRDGATGASLR